MASTNPTVKKKLVKSIFKDLDQGRFAIPKLQREFVWDGKKAALLLDSIYRGMPIGMVLIWETPKNQRLSLRQRYHILPQFRPENKKVWFLIDGQQRISVIHNIREGKTTKNSQGKDVDFSRVVFALEKQQSGEQILYRKPVHGRFISLTDLLSPGWQHKVGQLSQRSINKLRKCRDQILNYPMHFMFVETDIKEIRECFLRINTQGMKITTADATFTIAEKLDLRDIRHEVIQHLDAPFNDFPEMPVLFAMSAIHGGKDARGNSIRQIISQLEKKAHDDKTFLKSLSKKWTLLGRSFGKAIDYLQTNFSVVNKDLLYSDYLLSMLALFFFWKNGRGPNTKQKEELNKWFWATSVGGRYSGRDFHRCIPQDLKLFKEMAEGKTRRFTYTPQIEKVDVRKAQYASRTGITAAFYCMLIKQRPVYLLDDGLNEIPITTYSTIANRKDRHHIFPRRSLQGLKIGSNFINSISNICLLTAEENQMIGSKRPKSYIEDLIERNRYFKQKMNRHLIPTDSKSGIWDADIKKGFNRFLKDRTELICKALETEAGIRLFRRGI